MDRFGRLKAIHAGHVHVQQDHGKFVHEHLAQRFVAGRGGDELVALPVMHTQQQALEREQARGVIVYQEDFRNLHVE